MGKLYRNLVRTHSKARGSARAVLNILADYADDDGLAWPGRAALANDAGMSERSVIRCIQTLCDDGRLSIEENESGGRGKKPVYKIWMPEMGQPAPVKGDNVTPIADPERVTNARIKGDKRVTNARIKGDNLSIKGDKSVANQSRARSEPHEPTTEPYIERAHARDATRTHAHFDPRKFVRGKIPKGSGVSPAEVFYEIHNVNDDRCILSQHALTTIGEQVDDLARWRIVVSEWELNSYKPTNVKGQLQWYRDGIPDRGGSSTAIAANGDSRKNNLRGAEKNMSIVDQFEAKYGDVEL